MRFFLSFACETSRTRCADVDKREQKSSYELRPLDNLATGESSYLIGRVRNNGVKTIFEIGVERNIDWIFPLGFRDALQKSNILHWNWCQVFCESNAIRKYWKTREKEQKDRGECDDSSHAEENDMNSDSPSVGTPPVQKNDFLERKRTGHWRWL